MSLVIQTFRSSQEKSTKENRNQQVKWKRTKFKYVLWKVIKRLDTVVAIISSLSTHELRQRSDYIEGQLYEIQQEVFPVAIEMLK